MIHLLRTGDKVKIWPVPGARVKVGPDGSTIREVNTEYGRDVVPTLVEARTLKPEGETVEWSAWWLDLFKHGAIVFSDPRHEDDGGAKGSGGLRKAINVRHPHEVGADGKTALESGPASEQEAAHWVALGVLNGIDHQRQAEPEPEPPAPTITIVAEPSPPSPSPASEK